MQLQFGALAGAAGIGALTAASMRALDQQQKFARVIGSTQENVVGLQLAASELSGIVGNQTNMALQRMTRRVAEAAAGTGEAKGVIEALGLDAKRLAELDPAETFRLIGEEVTKIEDPAQRLRVAFKLFDSEGARLVTTLTAGTSVLDDYVREARELNVLMSEFNIAKIEKANQDWDKLQQAVSGIGNTLAIQFAPIISGVANRIIDAQRESQGFSEEIASAFNTGVAGVGHLLDAMRALSVMWVTAKLGAAEYMAFMLNTTTVGARAFNNLQNMVREFMGEQTIPFSQTGIGSFVSAFEKKAADIRVELNNLLAGDLPSDGLKKLVLDLDEIANHHAETALGMKKTSGQVIDVTTAAAKHSAEGMAGAFQGFFSGVREGVQGMADFFIQNLQRMVAEAASSQLFSLLGGGATGTASSGFLGGLLGFANGGSFTVGGRGGTDANLVAFKATKGETVHINTPGQQRGGGVVITNQFNFSGSSVDSAEVRQIVTQANKVLESQIQNKMIRGRF